LAQRHELVLEIERGSTATAHAWGVRWRGASLGERESLSCLEDRSSRPHRSPNELSVAEQDRICEARERTGWGPRLIAGAVGHPHSTVSATLKRRGLSRRPKAPRQAVVRYEWPAPGDLLHMDTKRYARFDQPGHAVTGDRSVVSRGAGWEWAHSIINDHSRLLYSEVLDDERAETVVAFTIRALARLAEQGITKVDRLMTDNAMAYTKSHAFAELLAKHSIRHLRTRPRTPRTNGKVERAQQTMAREWGYGRSDPTQQSATGHPSAAFTTSPGRTTRLIAGHAPGALRSA